MIQFEHVSKSYGKTPVLKDLNFTIPDGQFVVLIGPSGCGKTTTMKMINRLLEPDSGTIRIDGQDIHSQDKVELRRHIGYVIQQIGLFPNMTVEQNVLCGLKAEKDPAARRAAWMREKDALAQEVSVPVGSDPPPAPNCGWVLVRESGFPDGIPACTSQRDAWKLALTAQKNGAYAAAFEPLTRSAARVDILNEYETAAAQPAAVAKQLGRLVKHRLQK